MDSSIYFCWHEEACASFTKGLAIFDNKSKDGLYLSQQDIDNMTKPPINSSRIQQQEHIVYLKHII